MSVQDDPPAAAPTGRHDGVADGVPVAELIARARAGAAEAAVNGAGGAPSRPTRAERRAAAEAAEAAEAQLLASMGPTAVDTLPSDAETASPESATADTAEAEPAGLHLSVVEALEPVPQLPPAEVPRKSRAGRNLPAAIGVGVGLGAVVLTTLFAYRPSFVVVVTLAVCIGVYEMVTAISTVEARPSLVPLLAGSVVMGAAAWFRGPDGLVGALLLTVVGLTVWRLADGAAGYLRDVATGFLIALYVPFLAGFAALLTHPSDGAARIIIFILAVVCSDTGGYAAGVLFGRHPMAPTVSPKKSWEGFVGSLAAGIACGVLMMVLCFHHTWWQGALFGVAIVVTATLGDLGESMIKRDLGLKDMGRLLPGHGGIMDRLDSLLPCAPVAYLLLSAFLR